MASTSDENLRIYGTRIPKAEAKQERDELLTKGKIYAEAIESGMSDSEAQLAVKKSGIGSITPKLDRAVNYQNSTDAGEANALGGFKTYGDKSTFEAKNAVRKLQGLAPIAEPLSADKQFLVDLEKSASFGAESALVGSKAPKGQARAFEAGIRAGYTPEETRKSISDTAARITGIADQQEKKQQFVSDFAGAGKGVVPQPDGMLTPVERISSNLDKSFLGVLGKNGPTIAPTPTVQQPTESPKSASQPPFFERVYEQFKAPATATPTAPAVTTPVNPQNMTATEGAIFTAARGGLGGIPTPVLREAVSTAGNLLKPLTQTANFSNIVSQLDYLRGKKGGPK